MTKNLNRFTKVIHIVLLFKEYKLLIIQALFKQCKLQELLVQSQLKKIGIQTAQALIKILYQEIRSLKDNKQNLQLKISQMFRQYSLKEEQFKMQISFLQSHLRDVLQMHEQNSRSSLSKCFLPNSSRKLSIHLPPKSHKSTSKKSNGIQSPIKKMNFIETVSKQYVQYDHDKNKMIYEQVISTLLSNQMENMVIDFQHITDLVKQEKNQFKQYLKQYLQSQTLVQQLSKQLSQINIYKNNSQETTISKYLSDQKTHNKKGFMKGKKLFTTQNSNDGSPDRIKFLSSWEDRVKQQSKHDISIKLIVKQYQDIIQQYKQYSAYLKAYLCSCISFISKQTEQFQENNNLQYFESERYKNSQQSDCLSTDRSNNLMNFPSNKLFQVVLRDILTTIQQKLEVGHQVRCQLQQQNKQLRQILDQLVDNLKKSGIKAVSFNRNQKQQNYNYSKNTYFSSPQQKRSYQNKCQQQMKNKKTLNLKQKSRQLSSYRQPYNISTLKSKQNYYKQEQE